MDAMWQILQSHKADVVLNGHRHVYERFPKLVLPTQSSVGPGVPEPVNGIREFVVGTGGGPHHHFDPDPRIDPTQTVYEPNSEVHIQQTFGVLRLTLHDGSYDWQFLGADGKPTGTVLDSGTDTCHGTPGATTTLGTTPSTGGTPQPEPAGGGILDGRLRRDGVSLRRRHRPRQRGALARRDDRRAAPDPRRQRLLGRRLRRSGQRPGRRTAAREPPRRVAPGR